MKTVIAGGTNQTLKNCFCGWPLPINVIPVSEDTMLKLIAEQRQIQFEEALHEVQIVLNCPHCGQGHCFTTQARIYDQNVRLGEAIDGPAS